jgi:hypothetical protein
MVERWTSHKATKSRIQRIGSSFTARLLGASRKAERGADSSPGASIESDNCVSRSVDREVPEDMRRGFIGWLRTLAPAKVDMQHNAAHSAFWHPGICIELLNNSGSRRGFGRSV